MCSVTTLYQLFHLNTTISVCNSFFSISPVALIGILKFFVASESVLLQQHNIFVVANEVSMCVCFVLRHGGNNNIFCLVKIIKVFNLFITYGDNFLPSPSTYDELYYELIRVSKVFEDLYTIGEHQPIG